MSGGFLDLSGADTAGADEHSANAAVHKGADLLKVGPESSLGPVMGVTDVAADLMAFSADLASAWHDSDLLHGTILRQNGM